MHLSQKCYLILYKRFHSDSSGKCFTMFETGNNHVFHSNLPYSMSRGSGTDNQLGCPPIIISKFTPRPQNRDPLKILSSSSKEQRKLRVFENMVLR